MPLPILHSKPGSSAATTSQYKVFVSYSHKNSAEARQFIEAFKSAICVSPDVGIAPEQVFFDREGILAGDQWGELIQQAMDQAKYFVILLSPESIASEYCLNRELGTAVAKGLPIIQVLLSKCVGWADLIVPTDLKMRKLNSFDVLPKDDNSNYLPVAEWPEATQSQVWERVAQDIVKRVRRDKSEPQSQLSGFQDIPRNAQQRRVPQVQYFCNQRVPVNQFDSGVQQWGDQALLVLTRGLKQDEVPRFWDRLQHKNLKDYVRKRKEELLPVRPFVWPEMIKLEADVAGLSSHMLRALSDALTGYMYELADVPALATHLNALSRIQPLVTTPPDLSVSAIRVGMRTLLDLLEQCPMEANLQRLVIAVLLEDSAFVQEPALSRTLSLSTYQRSHILVLDPLQEIERKDVSLWYRNYEVEQLYGVDEDSLLQAVFDADKAETLRLREFAKKVSKLALKKNNGAEI